MTARFIRADPEARKQRLLREALLDVRALVPFVEHPEACQPAEQEPAMNAHHAKAWNAGVTIDGIANLAVIGAGVLVVLVAAATTGPEALAHVQQVAVALAIAG
ncbi:MAG: hypothetical protein IPP91_15730 [Betaproteobacteria bacterium]|nr:hypothetical protein [Betaproteobacteria bacterium]